MTYTHQYCNIDLTQVQQSSTVRSVIRNGVHLFNFVTRAGHFTARTRARAQRQRDADITTFRDSAQLD